MAWSAPMTAVVNATFTAAQFNQFVRDNLNETAPAKATTAGRLIVAKGANSVGEAIVGNANVGTSQTTTSTSYTDLATVGPAITVATGTSAIVMCTVEMANNTLGASCFASVAVSGATSDAAADSRAVRLESSAANDTARLCAVHRFSALTAGNNTFTVQYRVTAGTGTFLNRVLVVIGS